MLMAWEGINLKDINPQFDLVPAGTYTVRLVSAEPGKFDPESINIRAVIESDGPQQGRTVFPSYPNPTKYDWAPKAFARLIQMTGVDPQDGEGPIEFVNRAASQGARVNLPIYIRKYQHKETGVEAEAQGFNLFKVSAAA